MWQQRRWKELLGLIDHLPRNSAYIEALSDDEELAEQSLAQGDDRSGKPSPPRMASWSPELEVMTLMVDRLGEVMQAVIAAAGGKPPSLKPQLRPRTAIDRVRERRRRENHKRVVSRVIIAPPAPTGPAVEGVVVPRPKADRSDPDNPYRMVTPRRVLSGPAVATGDPLPPPP